MDCRRFPARYVLALMGMLGSFTSYLLRANISVAIAGMIDFDQLEENDTLVFTEKETLKNAPVCHAQNFTAKENRSSSNEEKFLWDATQQGLVLASFSIGTIPSLIALAYLSHRFGHVRVLGFSIFISSILTLLNPVVAVHGGYGGITAVRIFIGIAAGATVTQLCGLAGIWSPPQERSKIMSIIFAGIPIGISFVMPISGILASSLGWKSIFYATGVWGVCWSTLWLFLIHETPDRHPRISDKERDHINSSLKTNSANDKRSRKVPWTKILRSGPLYCLVFVHFCSFYGRLTLSTMFPTYMKTVLNLNIQQSGIFSAIPFMVNGVLLFVAGSVADAFISKGFTVIRVRKTFCGLGMSMSAAAIVGLAYSGCSVPLVVAMGSIVVGMDAFTVPGFKACFVEISPELTGVTYSMSSTFANLAAMLAPQITGALRSNYGFYGWQISFWIGAGLYVFGALVFCFFGTNEKQAWSSTPRKPRPSVATVAEDFH